MQRLISATMDTIEKSNALIAQVDRVLPRKGSGQKLGYF
jgi:hypothetical protein